MRRAIFGSGPVAAKAKAARNKYRRQQKPCGDCFGPLDENMMLGKVVERLKSGAGETADFSAMMLSSAARVILSNGAAA
jgi:hypothetical protein